MLKPSKSPSKSLNNNNKKKRTNFNRASHLRCLGPNNNNNQSNFNRASHLRCSGPNNNNNWEHVFQVPLMCYRAGEHRNLGKWDIENIRPETLKMDGMTVLKVNLKCLDRHLVAGSSMGNKSCLFYASGWVRDQTENWHTHIRFYQRCFLSF